VRQKLLKAHIPEKLQTPIETHLQLVGGVLVHCDVDSYPTTFPEDTRWKVAVAIHPRNSPFVTDEEFQEFTALLAPTIPLTTTSTPDSSSDSWPAGIKGPVTGSSDYLTYEREEEGSSPPIS
jgi:hypothetical protein